MSAAPVNNGIGSSKRVAARITLNYYQTTVYTEEQSLFKTVRHVGPLLLLQLAKTMACHILAHLRIPETFYG